MAMSILTAYGAYVGSEEQHSYMTFMLILRAYIHEYHIIYTNNQMKNYICSNIFQQ